MAELNRWFGPGQANLDKDPKKTYVVIDEVDTDNWGVGGEQVTAIRKRQR